MTHSNDAQLPDYVELPARQGPAGREAYGWIDFSKLPNTRDLGGLIGADGRRVKSRLLLRSGALGFASDEDLDRLRDEYRLALVVDLRNDTERSEVPDPMDHFPEARYLQADILSKETLGITQEKATRQVAEMRRAVEERDSERFMALLYPQMLFSDSGMKGYREMFEAIIGTERGAALWHCYVGRDRCGLGSILIESALGVSMRDMETDYLATNRYAPVEMSRDTPASHTSFKSASDAVANEYGDYLGYIEHALKISKSGIADMRARFLERR
ncbi:protein tyrosine/serine phosphatase [Coriobacterium glomerans PW2]|uniref:Protein tyrosine/serine phosphatase n=1 Tax=Coriobacterium glomerans (strain ATCC 49209 / DSM 20642 / JCM 10262 / PW2) TaxID=700015 RepID=F2N8T3_CORGP|nr:tyrosine-protein phosphatase [Coriobacterium glomerans]AEB07466.1 protein tyrosine/serine phosphatase [Coriobacterium glomerans PW2]